MTIRLVHEPGCWDPPLRGKDGRIYRAGRWGCEGEFECSRCKRRVGFCRGCDHEDEDLAEMCLDCQRTVLRLRRGDVRAKDIVQREVVMQIERGKAP